MRRSRFAGHLPPTSRARTTSHPRAPGPTLVCSFRGCSTSANSTSDNSTSASWPKSKLTGRSRTDGVCSVSSFSLSFFFFYFVFTFHHFFHVLTHLSLFILFLCCFCFRPRKHELNPKPRTLHPISDGPFRWTPPPVNSLPPDSPPPDRPKFRSFFHSSGVLRLSCETPAPPTRPGLLCSHTTARELQTCTFQGTGPSNTNKIPPQERERRKKIVAEEGKKRAKFWAPHPSGLHPSGLHPSGPHPSGPPPFGAPTLRGPTLRGPHPSGPPPFGPHPSPTLCRPKIQHPEIGRSRNWPKSITPVLSFSWVPFLGSPSP